MNPSRPVRNNLTRALARAKAGGKAFTAETWAADFGCDPSYVSLIAKLAETPEAILPAAEQTCGVLHVTMSTNATPFARLGKNVLCVAGLLDESLLNWRVDPKTRTITITAAGEVK